MVAKVITMLAAKANALDPKDVAEIIHRRVYDRTEHYHQKNKKVAEKRDNDSDVLMETHDTTFDAAVDPKVPVSSASSSQAVRDRPDIASQKQQVEPSPRPRHEKRDEETQSSPAQHNPSLGIRKDIYFTITVPGSTRAAIIHRTEISDAPQYGVDGLNYQRFLALAEKQLSQDVTGRTLMGLARRDSKGVGKWADVGDEAKWRVFMRVWWSRRVRSCEFVLLD
jgi:hypothetical protein